MMHATLLQLIYLCIHRSCVVHTAYIHMYVRHPFIDRSNLETEDKPSKRMKEFLETEYKRRLAEQDIMPKLGELSEVT